MEIKITDSESSGVAFKYVPEGHVIRLLGDGRTKAPLIKILMPLFAPRPNYNAIDLTNGAVMTIGDDDDCELATNMSLSFK